MAATTFAHPLSPSSANGHSIVGKSSKFPPIESLISCSNSREIKQIHGQMVVSGYSSLHSAASQLIAAYCRVATSESLDYAIEAFELLGEEGEASLFLWNILIRGYSSLELLDEAIELYIRMLGRGVMPDRFTFPPLLAVCSKVSAFPEGEQFHGVLVKIGEEGGVKGDTFTANSLVYFYAEHGEMDLAQKVFDEMGERNVVSWTSLIDGYARGDSPEKSISLFHELVREDKIRPNAVTMACVASACAKLQDLKECEKIFAYVVDSGIELSSTLVNSLVDMQMKCGAVNSAKRLFDECIDRNLVLWNTMVSNYSRLGMTKEAFAILGDMINSGQRPDKITMIAGVSLSAQICDRLIGKTFHGYILRNQFDTWDVVTNSLIHMYMECGEPNAAHKLFDKMPNKTIASWNTLINGCITNNDLHSAWKHFIMMPERDLISWNTMISALVQESQHREAINLFREMQLSGMKPDEVTMVGVASACGYLGALALARWTYMYINKNRIQCDVKLGTALVNMFAKCGDAKSSMQVFADMTIRDVSAWTAAIGARAVEGNGKKALELFKNMVDSGVRPDGMVFAAVLTACSHGGLVKEGYQFFRSISQDYRFRPELIHYSCMVDLLGRAGLLKEARTLVETMEVEPNDVIWRTLLSACNVHNDIEIAEYAAKKVLALAPERTGSNVLLSNAYARAGRWQDVAKVRLELNKKGVRKHPGASLIEIDGLIHEFTSNDDCHCRMSQIADMLREIADRLVYTGYTPDVTNVLMNVDEDEKEYLLGHHSEKMAVAYGLISTSPGVPIHIVKNLRTCADCHSFMKLVSAIYGREVTIRDNNRFHHFRNGICSCMDYW